MCSCYSLCSMMLMTGATTKTCHQPRRNQQRNLLFPCALRVCSGCSGGVDHGAEVHGRSPGAKVPHGHQRRQREDPSHDQNLRDAGEKDVQARAAGAARGGRGEEEE